MLLVEEWAGGKHYKPVGVLLSSVRSKGPLEETLSIHYLQEKGRAMPVVSTKESAMV